MNENIIFIIIVVLLFAISITYIFKKLDNLSYEVQLEMTKRNCRSYMQVNFDEFVKMFTNESWYAINEYKGSFFSEQSYMKNYIHASVWKINDIGLLSENDEEYEKIINFLNNVWYIYKK